MVSIAWCSAGVELTRDEIEREKESLSMRPMIALRTDVWLLACVAQASQAQGVSTAREATCRKKGDPDEK